MTSVSLQEPLPTALRSLALAMCNGVTQGTFGKGGGSYNWREIVGARREEAQALLRMAVETHSEQRLTLRSAGSNLLPFPGAEPIFLVVVCGRYEEQDPIRRLVHGHMLYFVSAPNAPAEGMSMRRLNVS